MGTGQLERRGSGQKFVHVCVVWIGDKAKEETVGYAGAGPHEKLALADIFLCASTVNGGLGATYGTRRVRGRVCPPHTRT